MQTFPFTRVIVIGTTGSGKSTLAEDLARRFDLEFIEMDALYWQPNWQHGSDSEFCERVSLALDAPRWSVAGNYRVARPLTWPRAEAVIWLDYPLATIFWRLLLRTWRRWRSHEVLWGTNYEKFWPHLKIWSSSDSLFNWLFKTYWKHKREYPLLFTQPEYAHLQVIHLHSPRETQTWLEGFQTASS